MTHKRNVSDIQQGDQDLQNMGSDSGEDYLDFHLDPGLDRDDKSSPNVSLTKSGYSTPGAFRKQVNSSEVSFIKNRVKNYNENVIYSNIKKYFTKWKRMARGTGKRGKSKPIMAIDPSKMETKKVAQVDSSTQNTKLVNQRVLKGHAYEHIVPTELFRFIDSCNDVYRIKDPDNNDK